MKVVLDSNVLISSLGLRSSLRPIWNSFINGNYQICVSEDILKEYEEIMYLHSAVGVAEVVMEIFIESTDVHLQKVFYNWNAISIDVDDNKFFDVAVAADVDFLVTDDRHFDAVKNIDFPRVEVISSEEFLRILSKL
ncbi:putative toxin-antitoxin system toxin component, PIN family [Pedobacter jejuensis]|uniref:Putative toxin-antitoxin system toxin component, PIN family n=1 Tax=Pedobacter jejuensis TaxID=1268550 RepID=A0A3N0BPK3_9SPHI|nr:putative toxin-antitoxin system toxin component, PIN family [Pedobacter jejuensis]RNL50255.1 putative toxin-antitoxin system toxin component, PIN family [Pedobacter jejuensis]